VSLKAKKTTFGLQVVGTKLLECVTIIPGLTIVIVQSSDLKTTNSTVSIL